ncbi:hypothetical protein [Actinoalloteichus sp. GBA129-24]|uniref:hypothetical protein n=1 Tax=Actinoalloteichus sp. GBA129-24 TaxID=1612551 RepID=UPI00095095BB|nr:hypothetical protein [Actinoalloteichus sp. GBA129-24]APU20922.1 hypothetical protein UA75_14560 [Actinoalloteichus sp. GBA129-24]APU24171.1 hypothetical protein UA75_31040 [Actinoalloteichus sp. GBA129-24]
MPDPIAQIRAILAEHGVDLSKIVIGRSDIDGEAVVYTGRTETESIEANYRPLGDVLRDLVAIHQGEPTDDE